MSNTAAILILVSSLAGIAESVAIKKYNARHDKGGFLFTAMISLFSMLFFVLTQQGAYTVPPKLWIYALSAGVLYATASFLTYVALECGPYALSMLVLSYSLVFVIGYGWIFLNEPATILTYIGLALILISLYFAKMPKGSADVQDTPKITWKWIVCIGISVVGSSMYSILARMQQLEFDNGCTNEFMIISLAFSAVILFVIGCIQEGKNIGYVLRYGTGWTFLAGSTNGLKNSLSLWLNIIMPISISSPVKAGVSILLSFLFSVFVFKEKMGKRQVVGVALGAVALVLLNI